MDKTPILEIRDLKTYFYMKKGVVKAVDGINLDAYPGCITAVIGSSGSGKSVMSRSILGLIEPPGHIVGGKVLLDGKNLLSMSERQMMNVRGRDISMIFQEPSCAMNPVITVKNHLFEAVHTHNRSLRMRNVTDRFRDVLRRVGLNDPDKILESYPFELSGGMCQRVMVAMGLVADSRVLIADEPTSSLDVTTQAAILEELLRLKNAGMAILLITHDLGVVAQTADLMCVIKDGKTVESGTVGEVFAHPQHPYTQYLMEPIDLGALR